MDNNCISCGRSNIVIAAPFMLDSRIWCIYRKNGDEVSFSIVNKFISKPTKRLENYEMNYIIKHILPYYDDNN